MQITLADLFTQIDAAKARMSPRNSHRVLFDQCQEVLFQMGTNLHELTAAHQVLADRLVALMLQDEEVVTQLLGGQPFTPEQHEALVLKYLPLVTASTPPVLGVAEPSRPKDADGSSPEV